MPLVWNFQVNVAWLLCMLRRDIEKSHRCARSRRNSRQEGKMGRGSKLTCNDTDWVSLFTTSHCCRRHSAILLICNLYHVTIFVLGQTATTKCCQRSVTSWGAASVRSRNYDLFIEFITVVDLLVKHESVGNATRNVRARLISPIPVKSFAKLLTFIRPNLRLTHRLWLVLLKVFIIESLFRSLGASSLPPFPTLPLRDFNNIHKVWTRFLEVFIFQLALLTTFRSTGSRILLYRRVFRLELGFRHLRRRRFRSLTRALAVSEPSTIYILAYIVLN